MLKVQHHFYKDLWGDFIRIADPRHASYINYPSEVMLAMPVMKNTCDVRTMQSMKRVFNKDACIENTALITGREELPYYVTVNDFLSRLNPDELTAIRIKMIKSLIRKRSFEQTRFQLNTG